MHAQPIKEVGNTNECGVPFVCRLLYWMHKLQLICLLKNRSVRVKLQVRLQKASRNAYITVPSFQVGIMVRGNPTETEGNPYLSTGYCMEDLIVNGIEEESRMNPQRRADIHAWSPSIVLLQTVSQCYSITVPINVSNTIASLEAAVDTRYASVKFHDCSIQFLRALYLFMNFCLIKKKMILMVASAIFMIGLNV